MENRNETKLIVDYLKGDEKALKILIGEYLGSVYGFILSRTGDAKEAEDITQETFIRMWRNLKKFKKGAAFKPWLFSIAKNAAIDFLRKSRFAEGAKKIALFSDFDDEKGGNFIMESLADQAPSAAETADNNFKKQKLDSAREKLSLQYRMILNLYYEKDFTFREIAKLLGEPLNTVKSRCRRGLAVLKELANQV